MDKRLYEERQLICYNEVTAPTLSSYLEQGPNSSPLPSGNLALCRRGPSPAVLTRDTNRTVHFVHPNRSKLRYDYLVRKPLGAHATNASRPASSAVSSLVLSSNASETERGTPEAPSVGHRVRVPFSLVPSGQLATTGPPSDDLNNINGI
ncbi:unnamed protein product [Calypogeia fissa]